MAPAAAKWLGPFFAAIPFDRPRSGCLDRSRAGRRPIEARRTPVIVCNFEQGRALDRHRGELIARQTSLYLPNNLATGNCSPIARMPRPQSNHDAIRAWASAVCWSTGRQRNSS